MGVQGWASLHFSLHVCPWGLSGGGAQLLLWQPRAVESFLGLEPHVGTARLLLHYFLIKAVLGQAEHKGWGGTLHFTEREQ